MTRGIDTSLKFVMRDIANSLRLFGGRFTTSAGGQRGQFICPDIVNYGYGVESELVDKFIFDTATLRQYRVQSFNPDTASFSVYFHGDLNIPGNLEFWIFRAEPVEFAEAVRSAVRYMGRSRLSVPEYKEYTLPENLTDDERAAIITAGNEPRPPYTMELPDVLAIDRIEVAAGISEGQLLPRAQWTFDSSRGLFRFHKLTWLVGQKIRVYGDYPNDGFADNWDAALNPLTLANYELELVSSEERAALVYYGCDAWLRSTFPAASEDELNKAQRTARSFRNRAKEAFGVAESFAAP